MKSLDKGFLILYEWLPAFESLSGDDVKTLLLALMERQRDGKALPEFKNPMCGVYAAMIEPVIKRRLDGSVGGLTAGRGGTPGLDEDAELAERFAQFWEAYPRKMSKEAAKKAFYELAPQDELFNLILDAIEEQKKCEQWQRANDLYIPYPASWLKNRRWEDEVKKQDGEGQGFSNYKLSDFAE